MVPKHQWLWNRWLWPFLVKVNPYMRLWVRFCVVYILLFLCIKMASFWLCMIFTVHTTVDLFFYKTDSWHIEAPSVLLLALNFQTMHILIIECTVLYFPVYTYFYKTRKERVWWHDNTVSNLFYTCYIEKDIWALFQKVFKLAVVDHSEVLLN